MFFVYFYWVCLLLYWVCLHFFPASGGDNVVYEYEYYYEYYDDPNAVKTENNNSVVINTIETSKADDDVSSSEATVPSSSGFSLQNILNLITKTVPAATEVVPYDLVLTIVHENPHCMRARAVPAQCGSQSNLKFQGHWTHKCLEIIFLKNFFSYCTS